MSSTGAASAAHASFKFFESELCRFENEFQKLCSVYPGKYRDWTRSEVDLAKKAIRGIKWSSLAPVVRVLKSSSRDPIYLVKIDDPQQEASSVDFNGLKVVFVSSRVLDRPIEYERTSELTHTLTHELMHFYIWAQYGRDYHLGPFWQSVARATDWTSRRRYHSLSSIDELREAFRISRHMIQSGHKQEALKLDSRVARKYGFPSLYATTQIEEFVAETLTYLIYDSAFATELSDTVYDLIAGTEFGLLLKQKKEVVGHGFAARAVTRNFDFVGRLLLDSQPLCTVFILQHGKAVTAKHCVRRMIETLKLQKDKVLFSPNYVTLEFQPHDRTDAISIAGVQLKSISVDPGPNDWAYIEYDADRTNGVIRVPKIVPTTLASQTKGQNVFSVGYALPQKVRTSERLLSTGKTTGRVGSIAGLLSDYSGQLFEATIPGWNLASGSPLFEGVPDASNSIGDQPLRLVGILSHTFDLTAAGGINPQAIQSDFWGFWTKTNFSAVPRTPEETRAVGFRVLSSETLFSTPTQKYRFPLSIFIVSGIGWSREHVISNLNRTREILKQCDIEPSPVRIETIEPPLGHNDFSVPSDQEIAALLTKEQKPALFFMGGQKASQAYGDEFADGSERKVLMWTAWISQSILAPAYQASIPKAYDPVAHLLCDCGHTESLQPNLLSGERTKLSDHLTPEQCESFKRSPFVLERL